MTSKVKKIPAEKCQKHTNKCLKFLCLSHLEKYCETCANLHKSCYTLTVDLEIERQAVNLKENFKIRLTTVQNKAETLMNVVKEKSNLVERNHLEMIDAVKEMRQELNEALDKLEEDIKRKAKQIKKLEENKLKRLTKMLESLEMDLKRLKAGQDQFEGLQGANKLSDIIIKIQSDTGMKKVEDMIASTEKTMARTENIVEGYKFLPNLSLKAAMQEPDAMGRFYPDIWIEHQTDFSVKTKSDTVHTWITGSTALPNKIIVTDTGNYKIKAFDDKTFEMTSELSLIHASWPWAVTKINNNKVATTMPLMKKILLAKIPEDGKLSIDKEIATSHKCHGLAYWDGRFIVTYSKKDKVDIIDMSTGSVIHTIVNEMNRKKHIDFPEYITLGSDNQTIFISNFLGDSILKCGLEGKLKGSYKDKALHQPRQTILDKNGILYICGYGSKNIHLITSDLKKIKVLSVSTEPRSICFSANGDRLFVDRSPDFMKVFEVSSALRPGNENLNVNLFDKLQKRDMN